MLNLHVMERKQTEWPDPIVFTPRKDGTILFCVDYRKLNAVTKCDLYHILCMDEHIDSLDEAAIFFTLDSNSGYKQMKIDEPDGVYTAFLFYRGLCRCICLPFVLRNAPGSYHRFTDVDLSVSLECAFAYLDDNVKFLKILEEHFCHIRKALTRFDNAVVIIKL